MNCLGFPLKLAPHDSLDAALHFARESVLAERSVREGVAYFSLWQTHPTVMLGRFQNALLEMDPDILKREGIDMVRRPSGGGTIFTDPGSFQFTFIHPQRSKLLDFTPYVQMVSAALRQMGLDIAFTGRNDLVLNGRKCSGNAQYQWQGALIHHGSLLVSTDLDQMERVSRPPAYKIESKGIRSVRDRVVNVLPYLPFGGSMTVEAFGDAFRNAILETPDWRTLEVPSLTREELDLIEARRPLFRAWENLWGRNPDFQIRHEGSVPGGHAQLSLSVEGGVIRAVELSGDFFADPDLETWIQTLVGVPYDRASVQTALDQAGEPLWRLASSDRPWSGAVIAELIPDTGRPL